MSEHVGDTDAYPIGASSKMYARYLRQIPYLVVVAIVTTMALGFVILLAQVEVGSWKEIVSSQAFMEGHRDAEKAFALNSTILETELSKYIDEYNKYSFVRRWVEYPNWFRAYHYAQGVCSVQNCAREW